MYDKMKNFSIGRRFRASHDLFWAHEGVLTHSVERSKWLEELASESNTIQAQGNITRPGRLELQTNENYIPYKQKKTVCRRCQQPGHIARDCTTDIQSLARSDQPAASGEGTGSSEVASTQAPPAKRQRRTKNTTDFYSSLGLSANSVSEQEQPRHSAPHCTTDIQALTRSDQPAASREGTSSDEVADTVVTPGKRPRMTT